MTVDQLIDLGLDVKQAEKVFKIYAEESLNVKTRRTDYIEYWKELNMKKKIEELRLDRYAHEYDYINQTLDPDRKHQAEVRMRLQAFHLDKIKEYYFKFDEMLTNYAHTFNDTECKVFTLIYLRCMKVKEVAVELGLSENYIRKLKINIDKDIDTIFINTNILI